MRRKSIGLIIVALLAITVFIVPVGVSAARGHRSHHRHRHHSSHGCIQQGNRGDNDPDNHGAPSDGDGCL